MGTGSRRKWLLPLLLALLALIALLFLLSRCGNDDDTSSAGTPTTPPTAAATTAPAVSAPASAPPDSAGAGQPADGEPGAVTAGGADLLGASADDLRSHADQEAVGRAVRVQSVPADEGFWVGPSEQDRLWVQLSGTGGESSYKVRQGDSIDFTGTVTATPEGFAAKSGVTEAEGAGQLTSQDFHVSAPASSIKLSD
jgi:hypothetical protein